MNNNNKNNSSNLYNGPKLSNDTFMTFNPRIAEYKFISRLNGIYARTDHMLVHKESLRRWKELKTYYVSFLTIMKLEINNLIHPRKYVNTWRPYNIRLNEHCIMVDI